MIISPSTITTMFNINILNKVRKIDDLSKMKEFVYSYKSHSDYKYKILIVSILDRNQLIQKNYSLPLQTFSIFANSIDDVKKKFNNFSNMFFINRYYSKKRAAVMNEQILIFSEKHINTVLKENSNVVIYFKVKYDNIKTVVHSIES